uniref:Uncharacterized protein n=1 Tax=Lepeophtheirus salmonis TaxID=72036 RepID=A0A0K2V344_LEPSM
MKSAKNFVLLFLLQVAHGKRNLIESTLVFLY